MTTTPKLALSYLVAAQAQKETTHNDALNDLDFLAQGSVISRSLATPPASPAMGDTYLIATGATGAWAGYDGNLAAYYAGWKFKTPKEGWRFWVQNEDKEYVFDGSAWVLAGSGLISASLSWTPGTLASGAGATSTAIAVSGAALGDFVAVSAPYDLQGSMATAYVSSANNVVVRLQNGTAGSLSFASGTWRVRVQKQ